MKGPQFLVYILFIVFILEITSRIYLSISWNVPIFNKEAIIFHYYPELKGIQEKFYQDTSSTKILVLGGSAVDESIYCDIEFELKLLFRNNKKNEKSISVYNLAKSGHTSLDSRYKRKQLEQLEFDYTFIYDGFNDCRANNIPTEYFDINYKHFTYYSEVALYDKYIPKHISILPFTFHYIVNSLKTKLFPEPHVPPYYVVNKNEVLNKSFWEEGKNIKTLEAFNNNLQQIYSIQKKNGHQKLILTTYAQYPIPEYDLIKFYNKELDYDEQKWPTEIYGDSRYIPICVEAHNKLIKQWKDSADVLFISLDSIIPKNKNYFHDICHVNHNGCALMAQSIYRILNNEN